MNWYQRYRFHPTPLKLIGWGVLLMLLVGDPFAAAILWIIWGIGSKQFLTQRG